jgi:hypothetical protein
LPALLLPALLLSGCAKRAVLPGTEDCAYTASVYQPYEDVILPLKGNAEHPGVYGNSLDSVLAPTRRVVRAEGGKTLYSAVNAKQTLERLGPDGVKAVLYDKGPVGQISYYAGYVYFSDYVLESPNGAFYSANLYRINVKEGKTEPEPVYQARTEVERFAAFQLANGYLYLTGSRLYYTFGVRRCLPDGTQGEIILSHTGVTQAMVVGWDIYYLQDGSLCRSSLAKLSAPQVLATDKVVSYCLDEAQNSLCYAKQKQTGLFRLRLQPGAKEEKTGGDNVVEVFYHHKTKTVYYTRRPSNADPSNVYVEVVDGNGTVLAKDAMPPNLSYLQPFFQDGRLYYFSWAAAVGYAYALNPATGERELLREWSIPKEL